MRQQLKASKFVVVKAGTSVVSHADGTPSLSRLGAIVETVAELMRSGTKVILVSSGAVGCGRSVLRKQAALHRTLRDHMKRSPSKIDLEEGDGYSAAAAAAGQLALMSLYETLFATQEVEPSQFLVTRRDFTDDQNRKNLKKSIDTIMDVGMVPIINENDAVSGNSGYDVQDGCFSDNDGLAALVAKLCEADCLIMLTDVAGLYDRPPSEEGARLVREVHPASLHDFKFGAVSAGGRGGMEAKVKAALGALEVGIKSVVLAAGSEPDVLRRVLNGDDVGTLFSKEVPRKPSLDENPLEKVGQSARKAARCLQALSAQDRTNLLKAIAAKLRSNAPAILAANQADMADSDDVKTELRQRLGLSEAKLEQVCKGVEALADAKDPVGNLLEKRELAPGLVLEKRSASLGVVLVIFEARPEALPQIAALALRAGCAVLLKGGSEARLSNAVLHMAIRDAIRDFGNGDLEGAVCLLEGRAQVAQLLKACDEAPAPLVDLVVPRGSNALVKHVQNSTRVPVLGHADGVCHVYIDASADAAKAVSVLVDSKCDYPAACNACETVLFHEDASCAKACVDALRANGVELLGTPATLAAGLADKACTAPPRHEYGRLACRVDVVKDVDAAVAHVNRHSSGHTDCIVTEDTQIAERFLARVDSADVFHNASTRFADGFRFGLGAELGIATGRIHARGPVGVGGFLTYKWLLRSDASHAVADFASGAHAYTHRELPLVD